MCGNEMKCEFKELNKETIQKEGNRLLITGTAYFFNKAYLKPKHGRTNSWIKEYLSIADAVKKTNNTSIGYACRKKIKNSGGFIWRFKGEDI